MRAAAWLAWAAILCAAGCRPVEGLAPSQEGANPTETRSARAEAASEIASARQPAPAPPSYVGVIAARESADVPAMMEGQLAAVHVRIGDRLLAGDLIASLDRDPIEQKLRIARAALEAAQAASSEARATAQAAREKLEIEEAAFVHGSTPRKQVVDARFEARRALAANERIHANRREERARVAELKRQLSETDIRAPFAGTVAVRYLDPGSPVGYGTPVVRLITGEELWVRFAVPADHASRLAPGREVVVTVDSVGASALATVKHIAPELEPSSQMVLVEAELATPEALRDRIQAGLEARVRLASD